MPFQSEDDCGYISKVLKLHNFKNSGFVGHSASDGQGDPTRWAQHILRCIGDAIISIDVSGRVTYLNPAAERMTGWSVQEALGLPMADVMKIIDVAPGEPSRHLTEAVIDKDVGADLAENRILIRRDGMETLIEGAVAHIDDHEGRHAGKVMVFRALTEGAQAKALRMSRLAHYDCLTDLPNRVLLKDRLGRALALANRYSRLPAVLFVDLDHFKDVNDSAGHAIGDRILQSIARRLLACVRSSDTVSRYGGDEFVVLLSEVNDSRSLMPVAKKILGAIAVPHDLLAPHALHITASVGVSIFPRDGQDGDTLIQSADAAMYCAKQNGGNNVQPFDGRLKT
jgi:diguanylate cyclase (GGDEF)-like protein/PAS domain S-box-containing protein